MLRGQYASFCIVDANLEPDLHHFEKLKKYALLLWKNTK